MSAEDDLQAMIRSARVVVFRSPVTDMAGLRRLLDEQGEPWRDVELGMGEAANRDRFQRLKALTGHTTLPQVFIDGAFVGGIEAAHERLRARTTGQGTQPPAHLPSAALLGGYGGLIPFFGLAAWLWVHPPGAAGRVLAVYAAVILSFVGAVHWGWALSGRSAPSRYAWSVVPALLAWIWASLAPLAALPLLAASFALVWYKERSDLGTDLPAGYRRLRTHLTAGVVASLAAAWIALLLRG